MVSMVFDLRRDGGAALYQQIAAQIKDEISKRRLPAGARLPTIRQLAHELGVTRVTVQNAYDELRADGWVESTIGRGTFVSERVQPASDLRSYEQQLTPDVMISDMLQVTEMVGFRSLASASPDAQLFPAEDFWSALTDLQPEAAAMAAYNASQGVPALRLELAKLLRERGLDLSADEILVTSGVTQGLALIAQATCRPGDIVLVEQPTYVGFLHTLKTQNIHPLGVPLDAEGPHIEALERMAAQHRPRFLYTIPTFQNPTGLCMSAARRQAILALAERYGFLVVEDDLYARIAYDTPAPLPMLAADCNSQVIYLSSFSKSLMPGLRLGYLVAPAAIQQKLLSLRRANDLCSPTLLQHTLARFLANGGLKKHLRRVLPIYRERRDAYLAAMQHYMPPAVSWTRPTGGFCSWVTLPRQNALRNIYQLAVQQGWIFAPGDVFLAEPSTHLHLRICFGNQPPSTIRSGVEMLSGLIRERVARSTSNGAPSMDWTPLV
jgi:DNA-binding transcriptional MocR family regulator